MAGFINDAMLEADEAMKVSCASHPGSARAPLSNRVWHSAQSESRPPPQTERRSDATRLEERALIKAGCESGRIRESASYNDLGSYTAIRS